MSNVYSGTKIFHFSDALKSLEDGTMSAPIHVRLKPTNRCNHRCTYCCYRNQDLFLSEMMHEADEIPQESMQRLVEDLCSMGVQAVTFSGGGEPLCYPHIADSIRQLADGGVKVAMLTNGGHLKGDVATVLAGRATWVRVSMDAATPQLYATNRGVSLDEFDRVCDNLRAFAALPDRRCVLGINFIITRENSAQVLDFLRLAKDMGIDHVKLSGAVVATRPQENRQYMEPFFDAAKAQITQGKETLQDDTFGIVDKLHYPDSENEAFTKTYCWCPFSFCLTVIAADQNIYTCQDKAYTRSGLLGSIREQRFRDVWFGADLRRRLKAVNPCVDCRHHCVAHAKNLMLLDFLEADTDHLEFV